MWDDVDLQIIVNRDTNESRGFGFVTMSSVEEAEKAVEMFNRYVSLIGNCCGSYLYIIILSGFLVDDELLIW